MYLRRWLEDFVALLYPDTCISCHKSLYDKEKLICSSCYWSLPRLPITLKQDWVGNVQVNFCIAYLQYQKYGIKTRKILKNLKYSGTPELSYQLGKWFAQELKEQGIGLHADIIVPIPLHPKKLKMRGYNQVDGFAQALAEEFQIAWQADFLVRNTFTQTQTKLSRSERWQNVSNIFDLKDRHAAFQKEILLVDDVLTTGATLESAAQTLLRAQCKSVSIATIAKA